jgi:nicotinate phosphoribosyltransferase
MKLSAHPRKSTLPGVLQIRRYYNSDGIMIGDMLFSEHLKDSLAEDDHMIIDPFDDLRQKDLRGNRYELLLQPLIRGGRRVRDSVSAIEAQANTRASLQALDPSNKRLLNPHSYPVGLNRSLHLLREALIRSYR